MPRISLVRGHICGSTDIEHEFGQHWRQLGVSCIYVLLLNCKKTFSVVGYSANGSD